MGVQLAVYSHAYVPFRSKERKINCNEWPFYDWEKYAVNRKANFLHFYFYKKSALYTVILFEAKSVIISNSQFQSDCVQALFCLQLNILYSSHTYTLMVISLYDSFQQFEPAVCYIFTLDFCLNSLCLHFWADFKMSTAQCSEPSSLFHYMKHFSSSNFWLLFIIHVLYWLSS